MVVHTAYAIKSGECSVPEDATFGELLQLSLGGCLTEDGNIVCLSCDKPNECCSCDFGEVEGDYHFDVEHDALRDCYDGYELDDDYCYFEQPEKVVIESVLINGSEITDGKLEEFCPDCGRSRSCCDCDSADITEQF